MHFTFTYIPHHIEKLQAYLDFLFYEVWCKAEGEFSVDKLKGNQELQQIYIELGNTDSKWAYFFNSSIETIYKEFVKLDNEYRVFLSESYKNNNDIEGLCCNKDLIPVSYDDLRGEHPKLTKSSQRLLFKNLWY